jgi:catechol 2,3-dioxygenase-like lactoylglutathione lyase family enzyme
MNLELHHLNLTTTKVPEMDNFYRSILGLEREPSLGSALPANPANGRAQASRC